MQVNKYKLIIPFAPDSINKVITYGKKDGDVVVLKHKWQKIAHTCIDMAVWDHALPEKFKGRISVFFKLYFTTNRDRDGDNYEAMCKGIIDALVQKRMIKDDHSGYIDDDGRRLRIDTERPRVEVYIKEKIEDENLVSVDFAPWEKNDESDRKII